MDKRREGDRGEEMDSDDTPTTMSPGDERTTGEKARREREVRDKTKTSEVFCLVLSLSSDRQRC
jgi:hypothetical protein